MTPSERDRLIVEHHGLVQSVAARIHQRLPRHVELDELVHLGMLGLIDAVERYDDARGVPLQHYAEIRIRGAILDGLRRADWVPRTVRRKSAQLETARSELRQKLGREPEHAELARAMGLTISQLDSLCDAAAIPSVLSLDASPTESGNGQISDMVAGTDESVEDRWISAELWQSVDRAIQLLPQRESMTVNLYYKRGLTLKEIGATLGVTESRACQLRRAGVRRLQQRLAANPS